MMPCARGSGKEDHQAGNVGFGLPSVLVHITCIPIVIAIDHLVCFVSDS